MKILGNLFILLGLIDFFASWVGIDFYAYFGILLTGYAYEYSAFAAGFIGFILLTLNEVKYRNHQTESSFNSDEEVVLSQQVSVRKGSILTGTVGMGIFFLTKERIGYIAHSTMKGEDMVGDNSGDHNFTCPLEKIVSVSRSLASIEILHSDGSFKFTPGITKTKEIVAQIEKQMQ